MKTMFKSREDNCNVDHYDENGKRVKIGVSFNVCDDDFCDGVFLYTKTSKERRAFKIQRSERFGDYTLNKMIAGWWCLAETSYPGIGAHFTRRFEITADEAAEIEENGAAYAAKIFKAYYQNRR